MAAFTQLKRKVWFRNLPKTVLELGCKKIQSTLELSSTTYKMNFGQHQSMTFTKLGDIQAICCLKTSKLATLKLWSMMWMLFAQSMTLTVAMMSGRSTTMERLKALLLRLGALKKLWWADCKRTCSLSSLNFLLLLNSFRVISRTWTSMSDLMLTTT